MKSIRANLFLPVLAAMALFLEDPSAKRSYYLDDEKAAKKFEGKMVVVTGTLDSASYTIRVQKIEAAT